jgi:hypothetical protein
VIRDLRASIAGGRLIALTAVIGSGKTLLGLVTAKLCVLAI